MGERPRCDFLLKARENSYLGRVAVVGAGRTVNLLFVKSDF